MANHEFGAESQDSLYHLFSSKCQCSDADTQALWIQAQVSEVFHTQDLHQLSQRGAGVSTMVEDLITLAVEPNDGMIQTVKYVTGATLQLSLLNIGGQDAEEFELYKIPLNAGPETLSGTNAQPWALSPSVQLALGYIDTNSGVRTYRIKPFYLNAGDKVAIYFRTITGVAANTAMINAGFTYNIQ